MKQKIIIIIGGLILISSTVAFLLWKRHSQPTPEPTVLSQPSQSQLQNALQDMVTKKAEKKSLKTQLAVYEKLLTQFPDSKDIQHRIEVLRQRIKELE